MAATPTVLWQPDPEAVSRTRIDGFRRFAEERAGVDLPTYDALWQWSTTDLEGFWGAVWDFHGLSERFGPHGRVLVEEQMPGTTWFPDVRVNYAQHQLAPGADDDPAVVAVREDGTQRTVTRGELRHQVATVAQWLRERGVGRGDRVVGYLPNIPEAVAPLLATASVGAVWSSVGMDYAPTAVTDRLGPLEPKVLVTADGYAYGGHPRDRIESVREVLTAMPSIADVLLVSDAETTPDLPTRAHRWRTVTDRASRVGGIEIAWEPMGFDDPLWVLFSSGTTGKPKGMVQSHGGIIVEMAKQLGLHFDLTERDRLFWFTSPSWVMWNIQASALGTGASIVTYDGSPTHPDATRLWRVVADTRTTVFGTSPGYLDASRTTGLHPARELDLSVLRAIGSTGSPISPATHEWASHAAGDVPLFSISGGTDICTAFCGGAPVVPIWAGELSVRNLGVAMDAWDPDGHPVRGDVGELVMTRPLPSMPVRFWDDPDGSRYDDAYFTVYPGVWRHGDWITVTERGSVVIHGRSDSTLNRQGVRMGSADIYNAVETLPEVTESLVLGVEEDGGGYWMPLFVVLRDGVRLDDALRERIRAVIREHASPRHVPDEVIQVPGIPHTRTGKRLEVPLKRMMQGAHPDAVLQRTAVDDPDLLAPFISLAQTRSVKRDAPRLST